MISTFIIGNIMIATGLTGFAVKDIFYPIYQDYKERKAAKSNNEEVEETLDSQYTRFFENLGLMDSKKGDWIKVLGEVERHEFYSKVSFYLSDTLSIAAFQKACENIRQKMDITHLEIYEERGRMIFRSRAPKLPTIPYKYQSTSKNLIPLGIDLDGNIVYWDNKKDPHAMIISGTGGGKSVLLNGMINHILNNSPTSKLYIIDCKNGMELGLYENLKNVVAYADSPVGAKSVIKTVEEEFNSRSKILKESGYRDFTKFVNDKPNTSMKRAYLIIDEFPDLNEDEDTMSMLIELVRKVRAVGIHILLASQRATVDSIPSNLKNNIYCKIGMRMADSHNSNLLIGHDGLEKLHPGEAIAIINNVETFFKAYLIEDDTIMETVERFSSHKQENKHTPKVKDLFK